MPEKPAEERRLIIDDRWVLADAGVFRYLGALSWTAELLASAYEGSEEKALALTLADPPAIVRLGPATRSPCKRNGTSKAAQGSDCRRFRTVR